MDEIAKGVDAAWRMSADNAVQDLRSRLSAFIQVSQPKVFEAVQSFMETSLLNQLY